MAVLVEAVPLFREQISTFCWLEGACSISMARMILVSEFLRVFRFNHVQERQHQWGGGAGVVPQHTPPPPPPAAPVMARGDAVGEGDDVLRGVDAAAMRDRNGAPAVDVRDAVIAQ